MAVGRRLRPRALRVRRVGLGLDRAGGRPSRRARARAAPSSSRATCGSGSRDRTEDGAWRAVRGGSYLDHAWGVRAARVLAADPARATPTTGFRLVIDHREATRDPGPRRAIIAPRCARSTTRAARTAASASSTWASSRTCASPARHVDVDLVLDDRAGARSSPHVLRHPRPPARARRRGDASTSTSSGTRSGPPSACRRPRATQLSMPLEELEPYRERRLARREEPDHGHRDRPRRAGRARAQGRRVRLRLRLPHLQLRPGQRARAARADVRRAPLRLPPAPHQGRREDPLARGVHEGVERRRDLRHGHRGLRHRHDRRPAAAADRPLPRRALAVGEVRRDGRPSTPTAPSSGARSTRSRARRRSTS